MTGFPQHPAASLTGGPGAADRELPNLWSLAALALRNRYVLVLLPLLTGAVAATRAALAPREYTAGASFAPQQEPTVQSGLGQLASQFGLATARSATTSPQFYADLLRSRVVLHGVVTTSYHVTGGSVNEGDFARYLGLTGPTREEIIRRATRRLDDLLDVRTDRNTGVVRLEIHTTSPQLSRQIVNRILQLVNDFDLQRRQTQARTEREFVEGRLAQEQQALTAAEESLTTFYARNRRFQESPVLLAEESRLQRRVSLRQQLYVGLAQSYENAKIQEVRNTPVITIIERPEDSLEPRSKRVVPTALVGLFLGAVLGITVTAAREYAAGARRRSSQEYLAFHHLRRQVVDDLHRWLFRD